MAFIEDDNDLPGVDFVIFILLDEGRELLNSRNDDMRPGITELPLQNSSGGVAVSRSFFKAVW